MPLLRHWRRNPLYRGANVDINGNFENDIGELLVGPGASVSFDGNVNVLRLSIEAGGSVTTGGSLYVIEALTIGANASLQVDGNLECDTAMTADIDPTATISATGNITCPAI